MRYPRQLVIPVANLPSAILQTIPPEKQEKAAQQPVLHICFYSAALFCAGLAPIVSKGDSLWGSSTAAVLQVLGQCKS